MTSYLQNWKSYQPFCMRNAFMNIMTHAKFHFNRLMLALIFGIRVSKPPTSPPFGPGERLKRPGLIELRSIAKVASIHVVASIVKKGI